MNFDPSVQLIEGDGSHSDDGDIQPHDQLDDITSSQSPKTTSSVLKRSIPAIDPTAYLTPCNEVGVALGVASQQLLQVHEAFAGDDVIGEFEREKGEGEKEREEVQLELPGESGDSVRRCEGVTCV